MATIQTYNPFFRDRGVYDTHWLGPDIHPYLGPLGPGTTNYYGYFICNPQPMNGATGKRIKGDFCIVGETSNGKVRNYAQQAAIYIRMRLECHNMFSSFPITDDRSWDDRSSSLTGSCRDNGTIKITTWYGNSNPGIYGYNANGFSGYSGNPIFIPELVGYRYHSNNGQWGPGSLLHMANFYTDRYHLGAPSLALSKTGAKSKADGGGGPHLDYNFVLNETNGVGLDKFRLIFELNFGSGWGNKNGGLTYYFPRGGMDIENPLLSVPDFCNVSTINWPPRFDAMSYDFRGSGGTNGWHAKIPMFKFWNGSSWVCF